MFVFEEPLYHCHRVRVTECPVKCAFPLSCSSERGYCCCLCSVREWHRKNKWRDLEGKGPVCSEQFVRPSLVNALWENRSCERARTRQGQLNFLVFKKEQHEISHGDTFFWHFCISGSVQMECVRESTHGSGSKHPQALDLRLISKCLHNRHTKDRALTLWSSLPTRIGHCNF